MNISEVFKLLKLKTNLSHSDLANGIFSVSNLYRFSNESRELSLGELQLLCNRLSITVDELYYLAPDTFFTQLEELRLSLNSLILNPLDNLAEITKLYELLEKNKELSLGYFNLYIFSKLQFSHVVPSILAPTKKDLRILKKFYSSNDSLILTSVDYKIFGNIVTFFPTKDLNFIESILFPIPENLNTIAKKFAFNALGNYIIILVAHEQNYKKANLILEIFKSSLINSSDYYNILHFKYLSSYTKYASTKSIKHFKKAITYIETIRDLGDNDRAASWESQLNDQQLNIKNPDQEFGYKLDNTNVILKGKTKKNR